MNIESLRKTPHLSFSALHEYQNCGLKYWFNRIKKLPAEFVPDVLVFGKCIHQVLEEFNYQRQKEETPPVNTLVSVFECCWDKAAEDKTIHYSKGKDFSTLRKEGAALIRHFYDNQANDDYRVLAVEEGFSLELSGLPYPIIGLIDLIEEDASGTIIITDYKTTSRAYSQSEIDQNMQLTLYQLAMEQNGYADRDMILKLDCLIKTQNPRYEQYYTVRNPQDMQRLQRVIRLLVQGISQEVFLPAAANWMCTNCPYKTHCTKLLGEEAYATESTTTARFRI